HSLLLSYVAKTIHYSFLIPYFLISILGILGISLLFKLPHKPHKQHFLDTTYRAQNALRTSLLCRASSSVALMILVWGSLLYFDLIASRPIVIDAPKIVEPEHGLFVFDVKMLDDNKLHRYAYITNEGKVVRFFLLNRFADRSSPGVVFDACALCGDMGYVKQGDELICIACNVRIFLPSVGKMGGCNPIPLAHRIENDKIIISVYDVLSGSNFFSQTQQKQVFDPVSGEALINFDAPFQYSFKGITYYFASEENQKQFIESPEKYVDDGAQIPYKIQRLIQ
ncbi:MAG: Fe-S-containing protein, partial [Helicobacter sp.]|nr:Fe-S-containing protein [Helicobacter sp.]